MTIQTNTENTNTHSSSENKWQMIDGVGYIKIESDNHGEFFYKNGGSEKVYLSDYYCQKNEQAKKDKLQSDITGFFTKQENDFASWRDEYASKIGKWQAKIAENQSIFKASQEIVQAKDSELNPLYHKYNTFDISKFSDGKDKKLGFQLFSDRRSAKHAGNVAMGQISVERMVIETYQRLMNHAEFCRNRVTEIAQNTYKSFS